MTESDFADGDAQVRIRSKSIDVSRMVVFSRIGGRHVVQAVRLRCVESEREGEPIGFRREDGGQDVAAS